MGVKLAIFAAIALAVCASGAVAFFSWWRAAEREVAEKAAQVEAYRAADDVGRDAVRGLADAERGARDEREKAERALGDLAGAATDDDFWRGLERLLDDDTDADARRSAAGVSADALRGGSD